MSSIIRLYQKFAMPRAGVIQSLFILAVRLYWGWQFATNGWGKLHNLSGVTDYFVSLNIPFPGFTAHMVSGLEFLGGVLLFLGLGARLISIPLTVNMLNAYYFGDNEAMKAFFSDPGKFYAADPYTFLFASLMVLVFGPGMFSVDALIDRALARKTREHSTHSVAA